MIGSSWQGNLLAPCVFALLGASALTGCGGEAAVPPVDAPEARDTRPLVEAAAITPETLVDVLRIAGRLEPGAEIRVSTELGGTVSEVLFDKGDRIHAGAVMARVGVDLLEAVVREAEVALDAARVDLERARELVERDATPARELQAAEAAVEGAEARLATARLRLSRAEIRAPAPGVVVERHVEPGEVLAPGNPVADIHQIAELRATVGIPERDIAFFRVGSPAELTVDAYPDRRFEGQISYIAPAASSPGRIFESEVEVLNSDGTLRSGLIVRADLERQVFEDAVVVSRDLIVERDAMPHVFVLDNGRVELRRVTLGPGRGNEVLVASGLEISEIVVLAGHRDLLDGQEVRVIESPRLTDGGNGR